MAAKPKRKYAPRNRELTFSATVTYMTPEETEAFWNALYPPEPEAVLPFIPTKQEEAA